MKDRRGEVWMYEGNRDEWAVAVIVDPLEDDPNECVKHGCIQLAGDGRFHAYVGRVTWREYNHNSAWDVNPCFRRLA